MKAVSNRLPMGGERFGFCGCEEMKNMLKKLNQLHHVEPEPYVVGRITV